MAISGQRDSAPVVLRIKLRYDDADLFIRQLFRYVNATGMFLRSPRPKPAGKRLIIAFRLANGESVFECEGYIRWIRPADGSMGPSGMGVEFARLSPASRPIMGKIIEMRAEKGLANTREIPFSPDGFTLPRRRAPSVPPMDAPTTTKPRMATPPTKSPVARPGAEAAGRVQAIASMQKLMARAEADVPQTDEQFDRDLAGLIAGDMPDLARALARARALVAEPSAEAAFDELLVDTLSSVPSGSVAERAASGAPGAGLGPSAGPAAHEDPDITGEHESPKQVVARLKRAAAKAAAEAAAEKAAKKAAASRSPEQTATERTDEDKAAPTKKYESPKDVVARLKRAAKAAAKEAAQEAKEQAAQEAREQAARANEKHSTTGAGDATSPAAQKGPDEAPVDPPPRRETPKEVVARLKRAAAEAAAREAVAAAADAATAATGEHESPKEVVARLKRAAAEAAAAQHVPDEPPTPRESPKEVVARLKRAAAQAEFKPPSELHYDVSKIPTVDGIPTGLVEVSEPEIRIMEDDGELAPPSAPPDSPLDSPLDSNADEPVEDDLLSAAGQAIPLSELEPLTPIEKRVDPSELAGDDFGDIETIDQPGIAQEFLDVGGMAGGHPASPFADSQQPPADSSAESVFASDGGDDFDFDSMFDAAVGPAALTAEPDAGLLGGAPAEVGDFGVDLLSDDQASGPVPALAPELVDDGGDFAMDSFAEHTPDESSEESAVPEASSELQSGPLNAVPAVLISDDSKGLDIDLEINSALESLSGNINARPRASDLDFDIDAAFQSAVADDPVAQDIQRDRAGTSSIEISFSDEDDEDELFDLSGPSGLELALQSNDPMMRRSSQVIAPSDAGSHAEDATMILDEIEPVEAITGVSPGPLPAAQASGGEFDDARARNSMSVDFDAGALDAAGLLATDLSGLASPQRQSDPAIGGESTLAQAPVGDRAVDHDSLSEARKPPLQAPPVADEAGGDDVLDGMLEELALDDAELMLIEEDDEPSRPPPPPLTGLRPNAPPPAPPKPFAPEDGVTADELAASEFGFGGEFDGTDGDDGDDGGDGEPKKRGFFGRFFKK